MRTHSSRTHPRRGRQSCKTLEHFPLLFVVLRLELVGRKPLCTAIRGHVPQLAEFAMQFPPALFRHFAEPLEQGTDRVPLLRRHLLEVRVLATERLASFG